MVLLGGGLEQRLIAFGSIRWGCFRHRTPARTCGNDRIRFTG
jgi:hypothetical protein